MTCDVCACSTNHESNHLESAPARGRERDKHSKVPRLIPRFHIFEHSRDDVLGPEEVWDSVICHLERHDVDLKDSMFLDGVLVVITDWMDNFMHRE